MIHAVRATRYSRYYSEAISSYYKIIVFALSCKNSLTCRTGEFPPLSPARGQ